MKASNETEITRVAHALREARRVLAITGAGLSADSGLPTYRGVGGLYDDAATEEGIPIEVALSGSMLTRRPEVCWRHIHRIEGACRGAEPNDGHRALAWLEQRLPHVVVLTQNVDGLHRRAGSRNVIEIHGDVHHLSCTACAWKTTVTDYAGLGPVPRCPACEALVRPDVVLFGEMLPEAALARLERELAAGFDVVLSIGTTSAFPYIAQPVLWTRRRGGLTVEVNPGDTEVSGACAVRLRARAAPTLAALRDALTSGD